MFEGGDYETAADDQPSMFLDLFRHDNDRLLAGHCRHWFLGKFLSYWRYTHHDA